MKNKDNKTASSSHSDKIDVSEATSLRNWADKLGTTTARLKSAVNMVGDSAAKVEDFLKRK